MRSTTGASLARSVAQRASEATSPALVVYRCEAFAAWITEATCAALKPRDRITSPVVEALRSSPCAGYPGVVALYRRGKTPAPLVLELAQRADVCTSSPEVPRGG